MKNIINWNLVWVEFCYGLIVSTISGMFYPLLQPIVIILQIINILFIEENKYSTQRLVEALFVLIGGIIGAVLYYLI